MNEDRGEVLGPPELVWGPPVGRVMTASMAADGRSIACSLELITSEISRVGVNRDSGQLAGSWETIYSSRNDDLANMTLSPDGLWLAVTSRRGVEDVYVMRTDGSRQQNLTKDLERDRFAVWYPVPGPDGRTWLTFSSNRNGAGYNIWAIQPDGTGLRQLTEEGTSTQAPRWWPDGLRLSMSTTERLIFDFPDGILGESYGPGRGNLLVSANATFSPNGERLAQVVPVAGVAGGGGLTITSMDRRLNQVARNAEGALYIAAYQMGNRWLDDHRLIFWSVLQKKALLWDTESLEATEIEDAGLQTTNASIAEFVFSPDGQTLFRQVLTIDMDIYLVELLR